MNLPRLLRVVFLGIAVAVSGGASASAHGSGRPSSGSDSAADPHDVDSRLDIVFVKSRGLGDGRARLTIRTAENWACAYLGQGGLRSAALYWEFNTDHDIYIEDTGLFRCGSDGKVVLEMNKSRARFPATRINQRTVRVVVPLGRFGFDKSHLGLTAISRVTGLEGIDVFIDEEDVAPTLRP